MKNFPIISHHLTKTSRKRNEDLFEDLFRCVVLGHVAVPEVHHCNLLAITEKVDIHTCTGSTSDQNSILLQCITHYLQLNALDLTDRDRLTQITSCPDRGTLS